MFVDEQGILKGPLARELAVEFNVNTTIFERDYLINALAWAFKGDIAKAFRTYIADGRANAQAIREIIETYCGEQLKAEQGKPRHAPLTVLDFASGYGRVGRHFRNVMPEVKYVGMDIHRDAVQFNQDVLGIETKLSSNVFDRKSVDDTYDFIFALSFFSHVRHEHFLDWLIGLHTMLKPGAILMFSTQGRPSHRLVLPEVVVNSEGYGMAETSEQFDLSSEYYIHAITYREYVERMIEAVGGLQILNFTEAKWFSHQDMFVVKNVAAAKTIAPAKWGPGRLLKLLSTALKKKIAQNRPPQVASNELSALASNLNVSTKDFSFVFDRHASPGSYSPNGPKAELAMDEASGQGFVRLSSGDAKANPGGWPQGYCILLPDDFERAASGNCVEVVVRARSATGFGTGRFGVAYSTCEVGNSGWRWFEAGPEPQTFSFKYDVASMIKGNGDFVGLLPDVEGKNGIDVFELVVNIIRRP